MKIPLAWSRRPRKDGDSEAIWREYLSGAGTTLLGPTCVAKMSWIPRSAIPCIARIPGRETWQAMSSAGPALQGLGVSSSAAACAQRGTPREPQGAVAQAYCGGHA